MKKTHFSVSELTFLTVMAALVYVVSAFFRTPIHLPGHKGILWVIPIIIGAGLTKKFGSATYIGLISGLLLSFLGMDADIFQVFQYLIMGFTIDVLALLFRGHLGNPIAGLIIGSFGNVSKMFVNYYISTLINMNANIIFAGIAVGSISSIVFGGLGGVISAVVLNRIEPYIHIHFPKLSKQKQKQNS